ncbi:uncharacterized protein EAF02_008679 [Botrytis sinoallii]|uniref:uncharacterized protein n=1 Tax=Botrytis sinoallii TaxID=1463999 RepID=UPI0019006DEA|nr:uncharacterized protein EAF02_008679 [Botrytis sinoallii]KAF7874702.1 hypothetical protein EAF02_008679 [Botrytis sinoallii]
MSYQEDTEFANEYPFEEVKTNRSSVNTQANGSPVLETDVVIRRYEMFGESPQIRKVGLVRRAGRIETAKKSIIQITYLLILQPVFQITSTWAVSLIYYKMLEEERAKNRSGI